MRLLLPVDGSAQANAALDFIASRTTLIGEAPDVRLLNVQPALSARVVRAIGREEARAYQQSQAEAVLKPAVARLKRAGIDPRASYAPGHRAWTIADAATRARVDLIVMGSRGLTALKRVLFGSMTSAVLATCTKPLLLLRNEKAPRRDTLLVGLALDGSAYGLAAARWLLRHRALFGDKARFKLVHVATSSAPDSVFDDVFAPVLKLFARQSLPVDSERLRSDDPGAAIAAHARKRRVDVLVMGSHGRGAFESLVLGSVAMRVAAMSDKPLLLIRETRS